MVELLLFKKEFNLSDSEPGKRKYDVNICIIGVLHGDVLQKK